MIKRIFAEKAGKPVGPYSHATLAGGVLYVSGQIPADGATGELVTGTIEDATHQVMRNLGFILEAGGSSFALVAKATIFLKDMNDFARVNEVYASYFPAGQFPARETVQVSRLPKDVPVEISVMALSAQ